MLLSMEIHVCVVMHLHTHTQACARERERERDVPERQSSVLSVVDPPPHPTL